MDHEFQRRPSGNANGPSRTPSRCSREASNFRPSSLPFIFVENREAKPWPLSQFANWGRFANSALVHFHSRTTSQRTEHYSRSKAGASKEAYPVQCKTPG